MPLYHVQDSDRPMWVISHSFSGALQRYREHVAKENDESVEAVSEPAGVTKICDDNEILLGDFSDRMEVSPVGISFQSRIMNRTGKHHEFLCSIEATLNPLAKAEFDYEAQVGLARAMDECGLTKYPPVHGDPSGDRCSGDMVCSVCGQTYYRHPFDWRVIGHGHVPFLNILCDGRRVKL